MACHRLRSFCVALTLIMTVCTQRSLQQMSMSASGCQSLLGGTNVTVLLVADVGSFTGIGEGFYYSQALTNRTDLDSGMTSCATRSFGTILGQPVALVATGIGEVNAGICTNEVLQCGPYIKDVIFSGTAGFSAQVGGAVDPSDCAAPNMVGAPVKIGDLCVSPFAVNWNCRLGSFDEACSAYPNQCASPSYAVGPDEVGLYGQCFFTTPTAADLALSDELIKAARNPSSSNGVGMAYPTAASYLVNYVSTYWMTQSNQSAIDYTDMPSLTSMPPNVFDYTECAEVDSQYFWTSLPWDYLGRDYVSMAINMALNTSTNASDVLAASAEEGVGFLAAMYKYAAMKGGRNIPHTIIRAGSDYTYLPVDFDGVGIWNESTTVSSIDFSQSYAFAIANMSAAVLKMLQARCFTINGPLSTACSLTQGQGVTYSG